MDIPHQAHLSILSPTSICTPSPYPRRKRSTRNGCNLHTKTQKVTWQSWPLRRQESTEKLAVFETPGILKYWKKKDCSKCFIEQFKLFSECLLQYYFCIQELVAPGDNTKSLNTGPFMVFRLVSVGFPQSSPRATSKVPEPKILLFAFLCLKGRSRKSRSLGSRKRLPLTLFVLQNKQRWVLAYSRRRR